LRLKRLTLVNFRNYSRLSLTLTQPLTLLQGENAQGKSNLLEAIYMLATSRSPRAGSDREWLNWLAEEEIQPFARIEAEVERTDRTERIEITLMKDNQGSNGGASRKQIRINGVNRRALDLLGHLNVVLFVPQDVDLVAGGPALRRRYLDITLCQISPAYCRSLSTYNRVIVQRNHLLRRLRERTGESEQLRYWDDTLTERGAEIVVWRRRTVQTLDELTAAIHRDLTGSAETLALRYAPSLPISAPVQHGLDTGLGPNPSEVADVRGQFQEYLSQIQRQEILQGVSLVGPHRDDLRFVVNARDLHVYGSRGQQRTAALSLKLAEMRLMEKATGEHPVLLLDDVMSELDAPRRQYLLRAVGGSQQAILTTTDFHLFPDAFLTKVEQMQVTEGCIRAVAGEPDEDECGESTPAAN
jgi:DNA replication and repair protein RecF